MRASCGHVPNLQGPCHGTQPFSPVPLGVPIVFRKLLCRSDYLPLPPCGASPMAKQQRIHLQCRRQCRFNPWVPKIPWRRKWQPTLVFLPGKSQGQRSLADYSSLGGKELDMTELTKQQTTIHENKGNNRLYTTDKVMKAI